ncbi:MAG TPA: hypothetical protein VNQ97_13720 [Burkholderiaceae bacterium]|nr:hypothetical protein [Burkholderiaceae bacterium]
MAQGKVTPFKGSKLYIQSGISTTTESITAVTATNPGTATITSTTLVKGDVVTIAGLGDFDGTYVVKDVATSTVTLAGADWSGYDVPASYVGATAAAHEFTSNFCEVTSISKTGGTVDQNEVTTICSTRKEYEAGLADSGTLQIGFNFAPAQAVQERLLEHELSTEKFWSKLVLPRNQGTMLYYGSVQTGMNMDGAVNGNYTSGVTIQLSGDYYRVAAA